MSEQYKFNQHLKCEFFPCHKIEDSSKFNCLFCYCPLYLLKEDCGGNFKHTANGIKDCSDCMVPHGENSYDRIMSKMGLVMERGKKE
jgi:Zn-finger protein